MVWHRTTLKIPWLATVNDYLLFVVVSVSCSSAWLCLACISWGGLCSPSLLTLKLTLPPQRHEQAGLSLSAPSHSSFYSAWWCHIRVHPIGQSRPGSPGSRERASPNDICKFSLSLFHQNAVFLQKPNYCSLWYWIQPIHHSYQFNWFINIIIWSLPWHLVFSSYSPSHLSFFFSSPVFPTVLSLLYSSVLIWGRKMLVRS